MFEIKCADMHRPVCGDCGLMRAMDEVSEWAVLKSASIWLGEWTNVRMAYEEVISIVLMCV